MYIFNVYIHNTYTFDFIYSKIILQLFFFIISISYIKLMFSYFHDKNVKSTEKSVTTITSDFTLHFEQ